eukprot:scaffold6674_cov18-Prasinocladus_malaysianus.AAC.1
MNEWNPCHILTQKVTSLDERAHTRASGPQPSSQSSAYDASLPGGYEPNESSTPPTMVQRCKRCLEMT